MEYPYESLSYVGRLSFRDAFGIEGSFTAYQHLRVLASELHCVSRRVWGDGDAARHFLPSSTYELTDADPVKRLLVSRLTRAARAGDELDFSSTRQIHHGFKGQREWWEFMAFTPVRRARIAITFPVGKEPEGISVSSSPGARSPFVSRPGTKELIFTVDSPPIGALYRVDWSW